MLDFERSKKEWNFTYKKGTAVVDTHKIYVWKVTSSAVYFRIKLAQTTPKTVFLKFTTTQNNDIMKNMQVLACDTTNYKGSSQSSGSLTLKKDDTSFSREDSNNLYKLFRTYSFTSLEPSFFGQMKLKSDKKLYDNNETYKSVTTESYEIAAVAVSDNQDELNYTNNVSYPNRTYCMIDSANPTGTNTYRDYSFPINFLADLTVTTSSRLNCSTGTDNPTITVGGESFAPATELVAPF